MKNLKNCGTAKVLLNQLFIFVFCTNYLPIHLLIYFQFNFKLFNALTENFSTSLSMPLKECKYLGLKCTKGEAKFVNVQKVNK